MAARIVENSAPLAYRKELEDLVVEVIARYPHTARWTVAIVGFEFLPGFMIRIEDTLGLVGVCFEDGFSKDLRERLDVLFGDEQTAGHEKKQRE